MGELTFTTVKVDWNQDGDFSDSGEDISGDVMGYTFHRSIDPGKHIANNDTATLWVTNDDQKYSPENTGSSLYPYTSKPNRVVQIEIQGVRQFTGLIQDITPDVLKFDRRMTRIDCVGLMKLLNTGEYYPPLYQNRRIDQLAALAVQELGVPIPGLSDGGVVGSLVVDTSTVGNLADYAILQKGFLSFPYAGDNLHGRAAEKDDRFFYEPGENQKLKRSTRWEFLKDLIEAEGGLLYFGADGKLLVRNRYWLAADQTTVSYTIDNDYQKPAKYQTPLNIAEFANRVDIKYQPRSEDAAQTTVWTNKETYTVPASALGYDGVLEVEVIFDQEVSATDIEVQSGTVVSAESQNIGFELIRATAQKARFRLVNDQTSAQTIAAETLNLVGNLVSSNSGIATRKDAASIIDIGEKTLSKTIRGIATHAEADTLADFLLQWHDDNSARMRSITLEALNPAADDRCLLTDIGTRINVIDDQTSNDAEYHVFGRKVSYSTAEPTKVYATLELQKATNTQPARYGFENYSADVSLRKSGGADKLAMSFQVGRDCSVDRLRLPLRAVGSPGGTMTLTIETDSSGDPSGTPVTNGTADTVDEDTLTGGYEQTEFSFSTAPELSADTTYWIVLVTDRAAHASNYVQWATDDQRQVLHDAVLEGWPFDDISDIGASYTGNNDLTEQGSPTSQLGWQIDPELCKPFDVTGVRARGVSFDGTNDYLDRADPDALSLTDDFTFTLWCAPEEVAGAFQVIFGKLYTSGQFSYELRMNTSDLFQWVISSDGTATVAITGTNFGAPAINQRVFITVWHDNGTEIGIQVNDGTANTNTGATGGVNDGTDDFGVGARGSGAVKFQGMVDELIGWSAVLDAEQRSFIYNGGAGRQLGELLGYTDGEMKSEASSTWSAESKDACFELYST